MTVTQPEGLDMTSLTDEQIDALAREHRIYVKRGEETIFHSLNTLTKICAFARALLAAAPAQSAEPAAFKPVDRCECAFSQDECEACEANREAYQEHLAEQTAVVLDDRAAFEAQIKGPLFNLARSGDGYEDETVDHMWSGWQARAASPQPVAQPMEQTRALTDFPEAVLSAIDERAAANIDDWAERQPVEPTKETCNAMYVRELVRLLSEQVC